MDKRPPCVLYQSFLVLSVFVHDAPNKGTHPPVMHLTSLESHHSRDLREAPSLAATAHGTLFVPLQRSACDWTQVSLMLLPVMAFGADAPHRPTQKVVWLIGFADGRRKVKNALTYAPDAWVDEKKTQVGYEISPPLYGMPPPSCCCIWD